jgi:transcription antitermination factor NusG
LNLINNDKEKNWYAVYTIVRHEKAVNSALLEKDIDTFLPLREVISQWKDRKKKVLLPLFPGYLFINSNLEDRLTILNTPGIVRILGVTGSPIPIPDEQVEAIKKLIESRLPYDPYPYYNEGKMVMVVNGPLQGVVGRILQKRTSNKLILSVDLIKRSVSVEVQAEDVELV